MERILREDREDTWRGYMEKIHRENT